MTPDGYMEPADWAKFPNFKEAEFRCHCKQCQKQAGRVMVKYALVEGLQTLRAKIGRPVVVSSGVRCPDHNRKEGGEKNSQHIIGAAADIVVDGLSPEALAGLAEGVRAFSRGGIGTYPLKSGRVTGWVHVDVRKNRARWVK